MVAALALLMFYKQAKQVILFKNHAPFLTPYPVLAMICPFALIASHEICWLSPASTCHTFLVFWLNTRMSLFTYSVSLCMGAVSRALWSLAITHAPADGESLCRSTLYQTPTCQRRDWMLHKVKRIQCLSSRSSTFENKPIEIESGEKKLLETKSAFAFLQQDLVWVAALELWPDVSSSLANTRTL